MAVPGRYTRLLVMNTTLATGEVGEGFRQWREYARTQPDLAVGRLLRRGKRDMSEAEAAAYDAPFPDRRYRAGVRRFPALVPVTPDMEGVDTSLKSTQFFRERWNGKTFMAIGMQDPVLGPPVMRALSKTIRGCPEPLELPEAGHFVQEHGQVVAERALAAFGDTGDTAGPSAH